MIQQRLLLGAKCLISTKLIEYLIAADGWQTMDNGHRITFTYENYGCGVQNYGYPQQP